jgi:transcriptional regulator with XRE-family HTH domain
MPDETTSPLRRRRLERGMTMLQLAQRCTEAGAPISEAQISRIERGAQPRPKVRAALVKLLDLDIDDLEARPTEAEA